MPKLSASVKASLAIPDHCFVIIPTWSPVCTETTLNSTSPQQLMVQIGPDNNFESKEKLEQTRIAVLTLDPEHGAAKLVPDLDARVEDAPLLGDGANCCARRGRHLVLQCPPSALPSSHLHLLQAAGKAAGLAAERPGQVQDLLALQVRYLHVEGSDGTAALSCEAVRVLLGVVDLLPHRIEHLVLVRRLETRDGFQDLDLGERLRRCCSACPLPFV